jgi:hypothetical protein
MKPLCSWFDKLTTSDSVKRSRARQTKPSRYQTRQAFGLTIGALALHANAF